jgi:hypothetical protein
VTSQQGLVLAWAAMISAVLLLFIAGYLHQIRDRLIDIRELLRDIRNGQEGRF